MTEHRSDPHANDDVIARYVAGTLAADSVAALEAHLLECAACERQIREGAAIRAALRHDPPAAVANARPAGWPRAGWMLAAVAAAVAFLVVAGGRDDDISRLGRVAQAPEFRPLAVRADAGATDRLVDSAMTFYSRGDFDRVDDMLGRAAATTPAPAVSFYLGVARIQRGNPAGALAALRGALDPPGNPYAADARFYMAKAFLALRERDSALTHLSAVPAASPLYPNARALMDSVRARP